MALQELERLLHHTPGWKDFTLRRVLSHEAQCYAVFDEVETLRCQGNVTHHLTVYVDHGQGRLGQSAFSFGPETGGVKERLKRAIAWAGHVHNPAFELPGDNDRRFAAEAPVQPPPPRLVLDQFDRLRAAAARQKGVRLCQSEVWCQHALVSVRNSRGLALHEPRTDWMVEFTLLAGDPQKPREEVEHHFATHRTHQSALHLNAWVAHTAREARQLKHAALPPGGRRDIALTGAALDTLFGYFTGQGSAQALFEGYSGFKPGRPVFKGMKGDPLTITVDPTLKGAVGSHGFDHLGCLLKPFVLVQDNRFARWLAPKPWADYAGVACTGELSNLVVAPGGGDATAWNREEGLLVLSDFSTFEPNDITGAFSAEIRLGHVVKGGRAQPVKGGSISGLLPQAFRQLRLSRQTTLRERYHGPAMVRLGGVNVTGG